MVSLYFVQSRFWYCLVVAKVRHPRATAPAERRVIAQTTMASPVDLDRYVLVLTLHENYARFR